jgi:hypothetical protein
MTNSKPVLEGRVDIPLEYVIKMLEQQGYAVRSPATVKFLRDTYAAQTEEISRLKNEVTLLNGLVSVYNRLFDSLDDLKSDLTNLRRSLQDESKTP